nr:hypothetical protein BaRGS_001405 [Batillaria attramentaria]
MLMNLVFLVAIMRVMVRQLQSHQEDQSTLRRGLRALLILIPLFGLQQFCIIYRPQPDDPGFFAYDVASAIIMNLQVQTHLKQLLVRLKCKLYRRTASQPSISNAQSTARLWRPSLASIDTTASMVMATTPSERRHSHYDSSDNGNSDGEGRPRVDSVKETIVEDDKESDASSLGPNEFDLSSRHSVYGLNQNGGVAVAGDDSGRSAERCTCGKDDGVFSICRNLSEDNATHLDGADDRMLAKSKSAPAWDGETSSTPGQRLENSRLSKTLNFREKVQFFISADDFSAKDKNSGEKQSDTMHCKKHHPSKHATSVGTELTE